MLILAAAEHFSNENSRLPAAFSGAINLIFQGHVSNVKQWGAWYLQAEARLGNIFKDEEHKSNGREEDKRCSTFLSSPHFVSSVELFYELLPFQTFPDKKTSLAVSLHHSSFILAPYSTCSICDCLCHSDSDHGRTRKVETHQLLQVKLLVLIKTIYYLSVHAPSFIPPSAHCSV